MPSALGAAPAQRVAGLALLADGEVQRRGILTSGAANGGDGFAGLDLVAGGFQQGLIMAVQAEIAAAMIDDQQHAGAAQPVGEHHATGVYGAHPGAGGGADQHAVPLQAGIAARGAEAGQQAAVHRPGQLAAGLGEGAVDRRGVAGNQWAAAGRAAPAAVGGGGQAALGLLAGALLGQLARLLGFAGLAGEGFLDGLEYLGQLGLLALAGLELAIAVAQFAVELGQRAAALVADLVQRAAAVLQFELLAGQQGVLGGQVGLDAVQLA
ncbi:hypothetical protein D3C80_1176890 [compost metagenome]